MEFSETSVSLTRTLSKTDKKQYGIYFTPPSTIQTILTLLQTKHLLRDTMDILEPSCGSGEFIHQLIQTNPNWKITGIEFHNTVYASTHKIYQDIPNVSIIHEDFIRVPNTHTYDLIIGNPPFSVIRKTDVDPRYHSMIHGRPNLFCIFILKAMDLLKPNGVLTFILPSTFLNSSYYNTIREHIYRHSVIHHIEPCEGTYLETTQPTVLLILQHKSPNSNQNECFTLP